VPLRQIKLVQILYVSFEFLRAFLSKKYFHKVFGDSKEFKRITKPQQTANNPRIILSEYLSELLAKYEYP